MSLAKQAKTLTKPQIDAVLGYLAKTRYMFTLPLLNRRDFIFSLKGKLADWRRLLF
jgi:hypothetical protein